MGVSRSGVYTQVICVQCADVWVSWVICEGRDVWLMYVIRCVCRACALMRRMTGGVGVAHGTCVACHGVCGVIHVIWCEL